MSSGTAGAIALLLIGGGLYWASTNMGDYFAQDGAAMVDTAGDVEGSTDGALGLVPDADTDTADDDMASDDMASDDMASDDMAGDDMASDDMAEETAALSPEVADVIENLAADLPETASEPGTTPTLDVIRVEPSGEVVIAGNAPDGERVGLTLNGEVVAEADVASGGDFVLIPDEALPAGEGTIGVVTLDDDGNSTTASDTQIAIVLPEEEDEDGFLVGVLRPGEPVEILEREAPNAGTGDVEIAASQAGDDRTGDDMAGDDMAGDDMTGDAMASDAATPDTPADDATELAEAIDPFVVIDAIELEGQRIWIAGAAPAGTVVRLYQNNELLGEALTGEEGRFLYEGTLSGADGEVTVRADALATGSAAVVARAEVPFEMPVLADAQAPATDDQAAITEETEIATADMSDTDTPAGDDMAGDDMAGDDMASDDMASDDMAGDDMASDDMAGDDMAGDDMAGDDMANTADEAPSETTVTNVPVEESATPAPQDPTPASEEAPNNAQPVEVETATGEDPVQNPQVAPTPTETPEAPARETIAAPIITEPNQRVSIIDSGRVIIRRGDNLWRISRRVFGQGVRFTSIYDANRDQIRDPDLIFPGQVFDLPAPRAEWGTVPGLDALEPDQIPVADDTAN